MLELGFPTLETEQWSELFFGQPCPTFQLQGDKGGYRLGHGSSSLVIPEIIAASSRASTYHLSSSRQLGTSVNSYLFLQASYHLSCVSRQYFHSFRYLDSKPWLEISLRNSCSLESQLDPRDEVGKERAG